jgi:flagellar protein FlaF
MRETLSGDIRGGFSTSASLLIIFVGVFIALGAIFTSGSNAIDRVQQAENDRIEQHNTIQRTSINVTGAEWTSGTLTVRANNTGTTTLSINETDVLVDGEYIAVESFTSSVDGNTNTDHWNGEEQLVLSTDQFDTAPDRIKLVTETGIAGTTGVRS